MIQYYNSSVLSNHFKHSLLRLTIYRKNIDLAVKRDIQFVFVFVEEIIYSLLVFQRFMRNDRDRSMYPRYETGCEKIGEKCTATTKRHGIPLFRTKAKPLDGCTHRNRANSTTLFARAAQFLGHGTLWWNKGAANGPTAPLFVVRPVNNDPAPPPTAIHRCHASNIPVFLHARYRSNW